MASTPPNSVGGSVDRISTGSQMPPSPTDHQSLLDAVSSDELSFTQGVYSRSTQQDESAASVIVSDVYRQRADELGATRYLRVDHEVQIRSQEGGLPYRSGIRYATDIADVEQYETRTMGQLVSAVGDGAGRIPSSVAELIAERDLERLRERSYVGSAAGTADAPSSLLERPGLTAVNSPVVSVRPSVQSSVRLSVMSDNEPVLTSSVHPSVQRDRDASVPADTTGQQTVCMTSCVGPYPDSFLDVRNQRAITATAGRYSHATPEVVNRRCGSPELAEDGQWRYREHRHPEDQGIAHL